MKYNHAIKGILVERENRFVARVIVDGVEVRVHVPNTGRCKEILVPGVKVLLNISDNPKRKYPYTLWGAYKGDILIQIDSAAANILMEEALREGKIEEFRDITVLRREKRFDKSRFDFAFAKDGKVCFLEVKGVTLENNGIVTFPDAPTERGQRHLLELIKAKRKGYGAYVCFVVQMSGPVLFHPNREHDPKFADALQEAADNGVEIRCYDSIVTEEEILLNKEIPIKLT